LDYKNNVNEKDNKYFDHVKKNDHNFWSLSYLVDNIFNDLMDKSTVDDNNGYKINKYIYQAVTKFQDFRRKSPVTFFDIFKDDLSTETKKHLKDYTKTCNTQRKRYQKLNAIMMEVIALIYKQSESLILYSIEYEDLVWIKKAINEIRDRIKNKWRFV
jgi:hypothetical protein